MDNGKRAAFANTVDPQTYSYMSGESGVGVGDLGFYNAGLTKREYFALHIYTAIVSLHNKEDGSIGSGCAAEAVFEADWLLKALEDNNG